MGQTQVHSNYILYTVYLLLAQLLYAFDANSPRITAHQIHDWIYESLKLPETDVSGSFRLRVQVGKFLSDLHTERSPTQDDIYQRLYWYN